MSKEQLSVMQNKPVALTKDDVPGRRGTIYPAPFNTGFDKRLKRALTPLLGLTQFGVNITTLEVGAMSSHRHWHMQEDEFIYVLEGEITLVTDAGETLLKTGMCVAFPSGKPDGHQLVNKSSVDATYLEVGTRALNDQVRYSDIDLRAEKTDGGSWIFSKNDGTHL